MLKEKLNTLRKQLATLKPQIRHCKICFKEIRIDDFCRLFDRDICICHQCQKQLEPKFIKFDVDQHKALALYEYSEFMKNQIYLYKGCFDYEMKSIFLNLFFKELKVLFSGYKIVPIPSYIEDDERRGFNHVEEVFKELKIEMLPIIEKIAHFKQAEQTTKTRKDIKKYLRLKAEKSLVNQRVLLVDDIYTTGSTMRAAIKLIEKLNPKEIRVLVLAKTKDKNSKNTNTNISLH